MTREPLNKDLAEDIFDAIPDETSPIEATRAVVLVLASVWVAQPPGQSDEEFCDAVRQLLREYISHVRGEPGVQ